MLELRWYHPAPRPTVLLYTKSKTICLDIFSMLSSSLPCAEIIGWHALTALFMTCFMKTASCIELGVCKGEFCFFALLGTGQRRCLISGRSQPGRLAVFPRFWKKKCYLNWEKVWFFFFLFLHFYGFSTTWSCFSTHHLPRKKQKKKKVQKNLGFFFDFMSPKYSHHSESSRQLLASHSWYVMFSRRSWLRFNEANRSLWQGAHALTRHVFWKC